MDKELLPPVESGFIDTVTSGVVEITVGQGDGQKTFYIHKILFRTKAPVFDKMFSTDFKEGSTGSATLPHDSCEAFKAFAKWLYSSNSKKLKPTELIICPLFPHERTSEIRWNMTETIALADKYCLDQLEELKKITSYITANTSNRCKARDFLAHLWAIEMLQAPGKGNGQPNGDDLDPFIDDNNFSKQVFYKMRCLAFQTSEKWQPVCDYHLHGKPGLCCDSTVLLYICPFKAVDAETSAHNPEKKRKAT